MTLFKFQSMATDSWHSCIKLPWGEDTAAVFGQLSAFKRWNADKTPKKHLCLCLSPRHGSLLSAPSVFTCSEPLSRSQLLVKTQCLFRGVLACWLRWRLWIKVSSQTGGSTLSSMCFFYANQFLTEAYWGRLNYEEQTSHLCASSVFSSISVFSINRWRRMAAMSRNWWSSSYQIKGVQKHEFQAHGSIVQMKSKSKKGKKILQLKGEEAKA